MRENIKKGHLIFPMIFLVSFLILSCDFDGSSQQTRVTGTRGLVMNVMRTAMPDSIYAGESLYMQLNLRNEGAPDIFDGVISVSTDSLLEVTNEDEFKVLTLRGDAGIFRGEEDIVQINLISKDLGMDGVTARDSQITINACYEYNTFFEDTFCLDADIRNQQIEKPCTMRELSGARGQGAPVVVSKVVPRSVVSESGARVSFRIYIYNSGSGLVLTKDSSKRVCQDRFDERDMGIIKINEITLSRFKLSDESIICDSHTNNPNEFDISDRLEYIECRIVEELDFSEGTFLTPMTIDLDYGYLETVRTSINVKNN